MTKEEFLEEQFIFGISDDENLELKAKWSRLWDEKSDQIKKLIEEHRTSGDLAEWIYIERDRSEDIFTLIKAFITEADLSGYNVYLSKHFDILIEEHFEKGDLVEWAFDCKIKNEDYFREIVKRYSVRTFLTKRFEEEFSEHRKKGDLIDYYWEIADKYQLCSPAVHDEDSDYGDYCPFEYKILRSLLTKEEKNEIEKYWYICGMLEYDGIGPYFDEDGLDNDGNILFLKTSTNEYIKYIFNLYKAPKDSKEYKRYANIRGKCVNAEYSKVLDARIKEMELKDKKTKLKKSLSIFGVIAGIALIFILIGTLCIHRAITKDARLAKQEAQRIEKIKVKNAKNVAKNQANDLAQLEKLGSAKLKMQDILVSASEPSMYIIAPMSYDTKKFVEDNSHDKGLFGTKDNSVERLTILESCITDFQNSIDSKTGVSFLDRSKISQIEKEHKFQLGDWSNNKKTAEVGKALNANILLFLDKFGFIDNGSGEYRFEAKFVDINTMQSTSYNVVYQNAKKKVVTPGVVQTISFRDFTPVSTKRNPFADEFELKTLKGFRTVQKNDLKEVSPLGQVTKVELSEFDTKAPVTDLFNVSSIYFDGFGSVEFTYADKKENSTYTFDAIEMNLERIGNLFFTDGKIGTLTVKTDSGYKKYDVFTENNREYYILLGSATLEKATVHYYLQLVKH